MKTLLLLALAASAFGQTAFTNGLGLPITTVAALPTASSNAGRLFEVSDGASSADCVTGGGSTKVLCWSNGTAWASTVSSTPTYGQLLSGDSTVTGLPITDFIMVEDFPISNGTSTTFGTHGWIVNCTGSVTMPGGNNAALVNHPGLGQLKTGTSTNNTCQIYLGSTGTGYNLFPDLSAIGSWVSPFIIQPITSVATASTVIRVGYFNAQNGTIDLSKDSHMVELAAGNANAANFYLKSCDQTPTCTSVDTTVTPTVGHWYKILIYSDVAGTLKCRISTDGGAYSTAVSIATSVTNDMTPSFFVKTLTTAARDIYVDYWGMRISGLTR
jgi:hypothetical protein